MHPQFSQPFVIDTADFVLESNTLTFDSNYLSQTIFGQPYSTIRVTRNFKFGGPCHIIDCGSCPTIYCGPYNTIYCKN